MGSAHSGIPDTGHASGPMPPFPRSRVGVSRPTGTIAPPRQSPHQPQPRSASDQHRQERH
jgi:hypothetical protein